MNVIEILNTVHANASAMYKERVPVATQNNIESIQAAMIADDELLVANEFVKTILNKLVKSVVHTKLFSNPLKSLKKGTKPLGDTIEEIYNNFLKAEQYKETGAELLKRHLPDTKTVYHRMNRQDQYTVTVNREMISKAFASYDALETYISNLINTLYNSASLDEYTLMKQLVKIAYENNAIVPIKVVDPTLNEANGKEFIKTVKTVSELMAFPSTNYNPYLQAQSSDNKAIITFSNKQEQVLIIDVVTNTSVNIDVLASLFNMSVAEFNDTRKIIVDSFPDQSIKGMLVDEAFFQIYDDLFSITSFYNAQGLYTNYYLNVWQTLAYSILVNAVVFVTGTDKDSDGNVETFTITKNLADGVTLSNKLKNITEGTRYSVTVRDVENKTVNVTMAGADVTDTVYNSETGKIEIEAVTGDIVITVA